jgi:hypothetical protein
LFSDSIKGVLNQLTNGDKGFMVKLRSRQQLKQLASVRPEGAVYVFVSSLLRPHIAVHSMLELPAVWKLCHQVRTVFKVSFISKRPAYLKLDIDVI